MTAVVNEILWTLLALLVATSCQAEGFAPIAIKPGDNVAGIVQRAPAGASFHLDPGIYRMQQARPKNGQTFIGVGEVIFVGAIILQDWRRVEWGWASRVQRRRQDPSGSCEKQTPLCGRNEDLFVNGRVYRRVPSHADIATGTWYDDGFDIYISDDPTNRLIELAVAPFAFASDATGVRLQNIVVEKYAAPAQHGAIEFPNGRNWELRDIVARFNHGGGARIGPGAVVSGGSFSNNGQLGLGGGFGTGIVIEDVEIANNNYAGYDPGWEAGGTKFVRTDGLVVRRSCIHNNKGPGLWTDIDNINVQFTDNLVFENKGDGIKHEISYSATIRGNTVARNGYETANWLWGSQILIQNSQDVQVHNNLVEVGSDYGNGISVINQNRGEGRHGPWVSRNNFIYGNTVIHLAAQGFSGMVADHARDWFDLESRNIFNLNAYVVPHQDRPYFIVRDEAKRLSELTAYAMEGQAKIQIASRTPLSLKCLKS